jgi:simple sugar transport system ATP-binding protein
MRDGEQVSEMKREDATLAKIAQLMVGRKVERVVHEVRETGKDDDIAMKINNLYVDMPGEAVKGIDLEIRKGEILGIGGLAGQGKIGIANGIMGLYRASGEVYLGDTRLELNNPRKAIESKLSFVSEDRRGVGLLLDTSIEINIVISSMQIQDRFLKGILGLKSLNLKDEKAIRDWSLKMIKDLDIRCTGPTQITRRLSGGNQQKVCIARALTLEPKILFVSEPTRGIDIGAKKLVLDLLVKLNKEMGMTIIMTSSELGELRSICDRISIVYNGKLEGILGPTDSDVDFGLMMAGEYKSKEVV